MRTTTKSALLLFALVIFPSAGAFAQPTGKAGLGIQALPKQRSVDTVPPVNRQDVFEKLRKTSPASAAPTDSAKEDWQGMSALDFIIYGGDTTVVPKGSILHVPESMLNNVGSSLPGNTIPWIEFLVKYPGIITQMEVSLKTASGEAPVNSEALALLAKSERIIVAVLNGSPISINGPGGGALH